MATNTHGWSASVEVPELPAHSHLPDPRGKQKSAKYPRLTFRFNSVTVFLNWYVIGVHIFLRFGMGVDTRIRCVIIKSVAFSVSITSTSYG